VGIEGGTRIPDSTGIIGNMPPEPSHNFREPGVLPASNRRQGALGKGSPINMIAPTFQ
jgi:hypothetical protein